MTKDLRDKLFSAAAVISVETLYLACEPVDLIVLRTGRLVAITGDAIYAYADSAAFESGMPLGSVDTRPETT